MKAFHSDLPRRNLRLARLKYGALVSPVAALTLKALTKQLGFSLELGDVLLLDGSWYVTHSGLLRLATRKGCVGIRVQPVRGFCSPDQARWAFRATAFKAATCKGFSGYGDADPTNVSQLVRGAEMRIAETRAVNRALRKAYGIGICSVEEIGSPAPSHEPAAVVRKTAHRVDNGDHPLRDRLLVLVKQHRLDAALVKLYAAEFCGVEETRQASREQMQAFVDHLSGEAAKDVNALRERLGRYERSQAGAA